MAALIDRIVSCFSNCSTAPEEQLEYYTFIPLFQPPNDIGLSEEDLNEELAKLDDKVKRMHDPNEIAKRDNSQEQNEKEEAEQKKLVPEKSEFEKQFEEETRGNEKLGYNQTVGFVQKRGLAPSKGDETMMKEKFKNGLNINETRVWMEEIKHEEDSANYLRTIFEHYDMQGKGTLHKDVLRIILTQEGGEDALTNEEFEALLVRSGLDTEEIEYEKLIAVTLQGPANEP